MGPLLAAAVPALIGGAGSVAGAYMQGRQSQQMAREQMAFQERMRDTQWQASVRDMEAAGLNPMLAFSQGPNAAPQGAMGDSPNYGAAVSSAVQASMLRKELQLLDARIREADASAYREGQQGNLLATQNIIAGAGTQERPGGPVTPYRVDWHRLQNALVQAQLYNLSSSTALNRATLPLTRYQASPFGIGADALLRLFGGAGSSLLRR